MCIRQKHQRGYFMSESQFNYLITLKNAHLSSNGYNCWMQLNTAGYVAWTVLWNTKFCEKILQFPRYRFFSMGLLFRRTMYFTIKTDRHMHTHMLYTVPLPVTVKLLPVRVPAYTGISAQPPKPRIATGRHGGGVSIIAYGYNIILWVTRRMLIRNSTARKGVH